MSYCYFYGMRYLLHFIFSLIYALAFSQGRSVAVIGGGTAGISAAHAIHQLDSTAHITLFERNAFLGGNAQTLKVENLGQEVYVDMGPQFYTEGAWDNYIALLHAYGLYDDSVFSRFTASFTISDVQKNNLVFRTPKDGKMRERFGTLLHFNKFYSSARHLYEHPEKYATLTVGEWIDGLHLKNEFKKEVLFPFLSASLGVHGTTIRSISAREIVKLFAFRGALKKNTFNVLHDGMGQTIQRLATQLEAEGIEIRTASEVVYFADIEQGLYAVTSDSMEHLFEFVVFATHPDALVKMVGKDSTFAAALPYLEQLSYFKADLCLHRDTSILHPSDPSFLNVLVDSNNTVQASTMDLGIIHPRLQGLYKSWLPEAQKDELQAKGLLLHSSVFYHPLITPDFMLNVGHLKECEKALNMRGIAFAGGWTLGMETQETAVLSGQLAAEAYIHFVEMMNKRQWIRED